MTTSPVNQALAGRGAGEGEQGATRCNDAWRFPLLVKEVSMAACEKCWADANWRAYVIGGTVAERYEELLRERKDSPCSEAEQRGEIPSARSER